MKLVVCALYDKTRERLFTTLSDSSVGKLIRDNARSVQQVFPHFLEDIELLEIGTFDEETKAFDAIKPVVHSWDEYKHPETDVKPLTDEQKKDLMSNK